MNAARFSPYPHFSWLGTWKAVGHKQATIEVGMRQVARSLIYTSRSKVDVTWQHSGGEECFRVDAGTVRFCPADDDFHTVIGQRCEPRHRFHTPLIPRGHLVHVADTEGIATIPELRRSVSARDAVLTSCMRTLSNVHQHLDETACERREAKFRNSTGLSLHRFVNVRRVRSACSILRDRVFPLESAASIVGFSSHSHFTRTFTALTGMTPVKYRKQFRRTVG